MCAYDNIPGQQALAWYHRQYRRHNPWEPGISRCCHTSIKIFQEHISQDIRSFRNFLERCQGRLLNDFSGRHVDRKEMECKWKRKKKRKYSGNSSWSRDKPHFSRAAELNKDCKTPLVMRCIFKGIDPQARWMILFKVGWLIRLPCCILLALKHIHCSLRHNILHIQPLPNKYTTALPRFQPIRSLLHLYFLPFKFNQSHPIVYKSQWPSFRLSVFV